MIDDARQVESVKPVRGGRHILLLGGALWILFAIYGLARCLVDRFHNNFAESGKTFPLSSGFVWGMIIVLAVPLILLAAFRNKGWIPISIITAFAVVFASVSAPFVTGVSITEPPQAAEMYSLKVVGLELEQYSIDNNGRFPKRISDLVGDYIERGSHLDQFHNPETGQALDWLYFPGHKIGDDPTGLLAASPEPMLQKDRPVRFILYGNLITAIISESDFQKKIKEQLGRTLP